MSYVNKNVVGYTYTESLIAERKAKKDIKLHKSKPTEADVDECRQVLKDFGIKIKFIPDFNKLSEMLAWQKDMIKDHLSK